MTSAIELSDIGKQYWKMEDQAMLLRSLVPFRRPTRTAVWALRHVDLEVAEGETVGILGRNGAGKTTMLRLLAGVSQPTEGRIRIRGRIAPLIGVSVGFHQEMSGRENVYVNGMLLGLTKAEVASRFDDIVAFAELADKIDQPVKFYSSGQYMRLGFSVAVHVQPQILLVDEVLAVGDIAFQLKCLQRMGQLQRQGTTILFVSHSMHAIRLLCPRAVLLRNGTVEFDGTSEDAISRHHELLTLDAQATAAQARAGAKGDGGTAGEAVEGAVTVVNRRLVGPAGPTNHPDQDDIVALQVRLKFHAAVDSPQVFFQVLSEVGTLVYAMKTTIGDAWRTYDAGDEAVVEVTFRPRLGGGTYRLSTVITDRDGRRQLGHDPVGLMMYLVPRLGTEGVAELAAMITVDGADRTAHQALLLQSTPPRGPGGSATGSTSAPDLPQRS